MKVIVTKVYPEKRLFKRTLILALFCLSFMGVIDVVHGGYAGYYLYGYETQGDEGVTGEIYTINPTVTGYNFICEWVSIQLSYAYHFWLQVGYVKGPETSYNLRYYYEYVDMSSNQKIYGDSPISGSWHKYYVLHPIAYGASEDPEEWRFYVDTTLFGICRVSPHEAVDEEAFVETTTSSIIINGSHFRKLSTLIVSKYCIWILWGTHDPYVDSPPYSLIEVSDYEFYANGGG